MGGKAKKQSSYTESKNRRESGAKRYGKKQQSVKCGRKSQKAV